MKAFYGLIISFAFLNALHCQDGCLKGDCYNGIGAFVFEKEGTYNGAFQNGKINGQGIFTYLNGDKYIGSWNMSKKQGKGKFIFANGNTYVGEFYENQFEGFGHLSYANGLNYEGGFQKNAFYGFGKMAYPDGVVFEGEWKKNKKEGQGTLYFPNGNVLEGTWKDGKFLYEPEGFYFLSNINILPNCNEMFCAGGEGSYNFQDGSKFYGEFSNGLPEGKGIALYPNGDKFQGAWLKGVKNGLGALYKKNGDLLVGLWESNQVKFKVSEGKWINTESKEPTSPILPGAASSKGDNVVTVWSVLIGVAQYTAMPTLHYTDDDAYQFYAFLKSPEGGALKDHQLKLLIDERATLKNIKADLEYICRKADSDDMIIFYFSGHGVQGAFLPTDYDGQQNLLQHAYVKSIIESSTAKYKLVIADACHAGSLFSFNAIESADWKRFYDAFQNTKGGTALLMSSKSEEYSLEDGGLRSGIFSHFLIKGLKGEADGNGDNLVTIRELYNFIYHYVKQYSGNVQNPMLSGDFDDNLPVSIVRN